MTISKRDIAELTPEQADEARRLWEFSGEEGGLAGNSFDAESMAPKAWIVCVNEKGELMYVRRNGSMIPAIIECELYAVPRASDSAEAVGMLMGECPKCGYAFKVVEDNKQMSVEYVPYRKAPRYIRTNWAWHCQHVLGKPVSEDDLLALISSSEPWLCDYCKDWGVKVQGGIASPDMTRVHQIIYTPPPGIPIIDVRDDKTEF